MATDRDETEFSNPHASTTDHVLTELQLHGYCPFQDEPDPRPLPEANAIVGAVADIFDALVATLSDTRLEPDLADLLWSTVNLFHRAAGRVQRELDDNEDAQKRSQKEQDGSEIRSVELERLLAEGITLIERRNSMEFFRDVAADQCERAIGSPWRPRAGSLVNHRALTAAMIDSREFLAAKRRVETEPLLPAGPKIAFKRVWTRHGKAAPFKRNDQVLDVMPIGVIVFPGSGISANLADKARKLGIPVWKFGGA